MDQKKEVRGRLGAGTRATVFMLILLAASVITAVGFCVYFSQPDAPDNTVDLALAENYPKPTHSNLKYVHREDSNSILTSLDLYLPDSDGPNPAIIYIHGGAWQFGDKIPVFDPTNLNNAGIAIVSANYRLSPAIKHPAHIEDVAAAIAFIRKNAGEYRIDPKKIFLLGHSAGAHLAALAATDRRRLAVHGIAPEELAGVILLDGSAYDIPLLLTEHPEHGTRKCHRSIGTQPAELADASPATYLKEAGPLPPFLLVHAGSDPVTARQTRVFADALQKAGATTFLHHDPNKDHVTVYHMLGNSDDPLTERVMLFIRSCLGVPTTSSRPTSAP